MRTLLTGNSSAAWAARLARVDYVPAFPITPQTEIIETLASWIDRGEMPAHLVMLESEHSMITAAGAPAATGVRVFTATSSQGLLYGMEMLYTTAGWRVPYVLVNVSRGLSSPITLEPYHNDVLAARDSGLLQIHCATCQEVLDSVVIAHRLAEDRRVRLPVLVNMDGFYLSFTREPVVIPTQAEADAFLPPFTSAGLGFGASKPLSQGVAVLNSTAYSYFRYQAHLAASNARAVYDEIADRFFQTFGRNYPAIEAYRTEDAELVFVMMGSFATKAKDAVDRLRLEGIAAGLVRPRLFRPFPAELIVRALKNIKAVAVIDQNLAPGWGGILHGEITSALYGQAGAPKIVASFVGGLGGRNISAGEFFEIARMTRAAAEAGKTIPIHLLFTEEEMLEVRKLQAIAHVERAQEVIQS